jgi:hypothetical protein
MLIEMYSECGYSATDLMRISPTETGKERHGMKLWISVAA